MDEKRKSGFEILTLSTVSDYQESFLVTGTTIEVERKAVFISNYHHE
jgi:hypothetical protein